MATEDEIKVGDTVRLKSGGPVMTVEWFEEDQAFCRWFVNSKLDGQKFRLTSLKLVPPDED